MFLCNACNCDLHTLNPILQKFCKCQSARTLKMELNTLFLDIASHLKTQNETHPLAWCEFSRKTKSLI